MLPWHSVRSLLLVAGSTLTRQACPREALRIPMTAPKSSLASETCILLSLTTYTGRCVVQSYVASSTTADIQYLRAGNVLELGLQNRQIERTAVTEKRQKERESQEDGSLGHSE